MRFSKFACCSAILFYACTGFAQMYTVTDLGSSTSPRGINMQGTVVGELNGRAFLWTKLDGLQDLGLLPGATFSSAAAINDLGVIAGTTDGPGIEAGGPWSDEVVQCSSLVQPFVWTQAQGMSRVGTEPAYAPPFQFGHCITELYAADINALGTVAGFTAAHATSYQEGFVWTSSDLTLLGSMWSPTYANGINNAGRLVGQDSQIEGLGNAASWKGGAMTYLPNLSGAAPPLQTIFFRSPQSAANDINDLEQIVGWSTSPMFEGFHAVLWTSNGSIHDLGTLPGDTLSAAARINFYGQVIGSSGNALDYVRTSRMVDPIQVLGRPFIWSEPSGMKDLNTLILPDSGWVLDSVTDVSSEGQIVGEGTLNGEPHGLLLTPIYKAFAQQPINSDGSSVFNAKRGVIPVKFKLTQYEVPTCTSVPATIAVTRIAGGTLGAIDENTYLTNADTGSDFRIDPSACQYVYNLAVSSLGVGTYLVDINIDGIAVGHAVFALK